MGHLLQSRSDVGQSVSEAVMMRVTEEEGWNCPSPTHATMGGKLVPSQRRLIKQ